MHLSPTSKLGYLSFNRVVGLVDASCFACSTSGKHNQGLSMSYMSWWIGMAFKCNSPIVFFKSLASRHNSLRNQNT